MKSILLSVALLTLGACTCGSPVDDIGVPGKCNLQQPQSVPAPLDVLVVMDNSNSMLDKQDAVAKNMDAFVGVLHNSLDVARDFHFGVITTSVYQSARGGPLTLFPTQSGRLQAVGGETMLSGDDPDF